MPRGRLITPAITTALITRMATQRLGPRSFQPGRIRPVRLGGAARPCSLASSCLPAITRSDEITPVATRSTTRAPFMPGPPRLAGALRWPLTPETRMKCMGPGGPTSRPRTMRQASRATSDTPATDSQLLPEVSTPMRDARIIPAPTNGSSLNRSECSRYAKNRAVKVPREVMRPSDCWPARVNAASGRPVASAASRPTRQRHGPSFSSNSCSLRPAGDRALTRPSYHQLAPARSCAASHREAVVLFVQEYQPGEVEAVDSAALLRPG